jgi:hypothetical protein
LSPLDSVTRTEQITRVLRSAQSVFCTPNDSGHEHFEVRLHHPIDTTHLCDSVKLVQIQSAASSCLDERFDDDIDSNLVAESEAVGVAETRMSRSGGYERCGTRVPRGMASHTSRGSCVPMLWNRRADSRQTPPEGTAPQARASE